MVTLKDLEGLEDAVYTAERQYALARDTYIMQHAPYKVGEVLPERNEPSPYGHAFIRKSIKVKRIGLSRNVGPGWQWEFYGPIIRKDGSVSLSRRDTQNFPVEEKA